MSITALNPLYTESALLTGSQAGAIPARTSSLYGFIKIERSEFQCTNQTVVPTQHHTTERTLIT